MDAKCELGEHQLLTLTGDDRYCPNCGHVEKAK